MHLSAQTKTGKEDRFSFRTNAFDWLLTVPNFQIAYDLKPGEYNNESLLAEIKFNGHTYQSANVVQYYVFDLTDIRGEYRYYYRHTRQKEGEPFDFWSFARPNPRPWIAHYLGAYADWSLFRIKPGQTGIKGWQGGVGVSAGIEIPLYEYPGGAVDLDLGASAGLSWVNMDTFKRSIDQIEYIPKRDNIINFPLPLITELRATFSWSRRSVRTKYVKTDPEIPMMKQAISDMETEFKATRKANFDEYLKSTGRLAAVQASDTTYRREFVEWVKQAEEDQIQRNIEYLPVNEERKVKLRKRVQRLGKDSIKEFDRIIRDEKNAVLNAEKEARKAEQEAERDAKKAAREAEKAKEAEAGNQEGEE